MLMKNAPLISIGLPTYNRAAHLRQAIESVLAQDYSHLELVISDNASTDETQSMCEEFSAQDSRVKYIRQLSNRGAGPNFLEVLQQARGEFFMWLGDDDWLDSSYVSQCTRELIENADYSLVCGIARYFQNGKFLLEGENISLLQSSPADRVVAYYQQVYANGAFYGLMRPAHLRLVLPQKVLGGDWLLIAAIAFMGKTKTIKSTAVNRSWDGISRDTKTLVAILGISRVHARAPQLSIALSAFTDIAWKSPVYAALGRAARLELAGRVFAVFYRRHFERYWRDTVNSWRARLYPYWSRPIFYAISVKNRMKSVIMRAARFIKRTATKVLWKLGLYNSARRLFPFFKRVAARLRSERLVSKRIDSYLTVARSRALNGCASEPGSDAKFRNAWLRFRGAPDKLPIPPAELLFTVAGDPNVAWFLHGGRLGAESINRILERNRVDYASWKSILDLGCGCGRVIRHLDFFNGAKLIGTDYNPTLIEWCDANLKFGQFDVNELEPPLKYADKSLDFVYALSVFTHLTESLQLLWMKELERVLRPGGYLLITTAGSFYQYRLNPTELAQFENGEMVVWDAGREGSNYCAAFHPEEYVRTKLAVGFDVVDFVPEGARGNPWQDLYLLRKKS